MKQNLLNSLRLRLCMLVAFLCALSTSVWATDVTLSYSGSSTTNMVSGNNAATVGLSADAWSVTAVPTAAATPLYPGLNKAGNIRLYYNATTSNSITVASLNNSIINSITVNYGSQTKSGTTTYYNGGIVTVSGNTISDSNSADGVGQYAINSSSFTISNGNSSNVQVWITSIVITYTPTHTLTYSATNGSISGVVYNTSTAVASGASVAEGGKVTLTAEPASGYQFDSWSVSGTGSTLSSTSTNPSTFTMGTANATVTANFTAAGSTTTYSVTYDGNGNTAGSVPSDDNSYEANASVTVLGNTGSLAKTGNAFGGWCMNAEGTGTVYGPNNTATFNITGNTTLYAKWTPYTITAASNNNSYGTVSLSGSVITASPNSGYRYADPAYSVSPANSATVSQEGNAFTVTPSANTTVTINFEAIPTRTATFSVNGAASYNTFYEGQTISFPSDPADINGKSFVGWTTATISGTTNDAPSVVNKSTETMGNSDVTYYAVFATVSGSTTPANMVINTSTANFPTSYGTANTFAEYTLNGKKFQIQQGYINGTKLQWRASGNASGTGTMYNSDAINKIQSIVLLYDSSDSNKNFTVQVGTSANPTSSSAITPSVSQQNTSEYTFTSPSGNYDYFVLTNGSGAGYLTSITINYIEDNQTVSDYCTTVAAAVAVTGVTLNQNTATLEVSETVTLTATVAPNDATNKNVTWTSSDETVATVENGVVTAVGVGSATITVTSVADNTKTATCTVTVNPTAVSSVSVDATASVNVGETTTLTATVAPNNATNKNVTWTSSNTAIATVDANGVVTGVAEGTATITVTSAADNTKIATCTVTVTLVPGTAAKPYTVAEALEVIAALADNGTLDDKYVSGKISQVDSYNSTYSSITYWISDDGTTSNQLQVYSGKGLNGDGFSAMTDLEVGDEVVVKGQLKKYVKNSTTTPEFNQNSQLVSRTTKTASDLTKTSDISLSMANPSVTATATDYFTTSSIGALSYEIADETVATVSNTGVVTSVAAGTTTLTVSQAADATYKAGSLEITVTVAAASLNETTIAANASGSTTYGTNKVEGYMIDDTYDGTVAAVSSNSSVATVAITQHTSGEGTFTITPVAVGTAVITISAPATATCEAADDVTYTITVNAPVGQTTAAVAATTLFNETFANCGGTNNDFGTSTTSDGNGAFEADSDWGSLDNAYGANGAAKFGASKKVGFARTSDLTVTEGTTYKLTFKAAPWASESTTMTVDVAGGTINNAATVESLAMTTGKWNEFSYNIVATSTTMSIGFSASNNRFFLDEVKVTEGEEITAKLNASGYATYCSQYPLDFSSATDYSAWQITNINSYNEITFEKVTGSVKSGTGLFLVGEENASITLTSVANNNVLDDNLLEGTLAPTYFAAGEIYGLAGATFKKNVAGTIKANKAYLDAGLINSNPSSARAFTFVFVDTTTGITETQNVSAEEFGEIFNLAGQRLNQPQRGVNIINGKRVLVK